MNLYLMCNHNLHNPIKHNRAPKEKNHFDNFMNFDNLALFPYYKF